MTAWRRHCLLAIALTNGSITSCCSTAEKRPHHCCRLPNNFGSPRMFPIRFGKVQTPWAFFFPFGGIRAPPDRRLLGAHLSQNLKPHLNRFSRFQPRHSACTGTDRIHAMHAMRPNHNKAASRRQQTPPPTASRPVRRYACGQTDRQTREHKNTQTRVLVTIRNESAPIQLAQRWFPGLAVSNAEI